MWIQYNSSILANMFMGTSVRKGTTKKGKLLWPLDADSFLSFGGKQG